MPEVINDTNLITQDKLFLLIKEADELTRILAASGKIIERKISK